MIEEDVLDCIFPRTHVSSLRMATLAATGPIFLCGFPQRQYSSTLPEP